MSAIDLEALRAEAERLAAMCNNVGDVEECPRPEFFEKCPDCFCGDVTPEHWFEILKREAENAAIVE